MKASNTKIAYISSIDFEFQSTKDRLKQLGGYDWIKADKNIGEINLEALRDYHILIVSPDARERYDEKFFLSLPNLKFLSTATSGFEYIDRDMAGKHGVIVSNCIGANSESVAEHAFGLLLGLSKRIVQYDRDVRNKGVYRYDGYSGHELLNKSIGIIGYGQIGEKVARISKAFNMKVYAFSRTTKDVKNVKFVDLQTLLSESDYVVICAPLNEGTKNLMNKETLALMKKGSYLVNISRDEIVNNADLCLFLDNGHLSGFGLDGTVYTPIDKSLLKYDNVIVNAHNGFNTDEANERVEHTAVANVNAYLEGNPQNVVN